jgi:inosine-uridine nucleoside N-ribohydrolase
MSLTLVGVDDILAMLLALAAKPEEVEVLMLSVTYGNVEVQRYLLKILIHGLC